MADPAKVAVRAVTPVVAGMRAAGVDWQQALGEVGLTQDELRDEAHRVSHERVIRLWQRAVEVTGNPDFGLTVSAMIPPGQFGVVEYAFRKSASVLDGFERVCRYFRIHHDVARWNLARDGGRVVLEHSLPGARTLPRAACDFVLCNFVRVCADATGKTIKPSEVWLDYAEPDDTGMLRERFGDNLRFDTGRRALVYTEDAAAAPLTTAEPQLCSILDAHARELLASLPTISSFGDRVREILSEQLNGGNPTAQETARSLKMSVRTLHRRLADEDTSHKQLLAELRRELATRYLRDRGIAISEVAFLLGFSEPSAFHRAFRRWTGTTPAEFRANG